MNSVSAIEQVRPTHEVATSADGTKLAYIHWQASQTHTGATTAIVLHGIGYHSEPYEVLAHGLNQQGIDVYAVDARGHGQSEGKRGEVPTPTQIRIDIDAIIALIRYTASDTRIFLVGDSMGAAFAVAYLTNPSPELSGAVLLAPPLKLKRTQLFTLSNLRDILHGFFRPNGRVVSLIDSRLEESSRSEEFITQRRSDPLAYQKVSIRYLRGISRLTKGWKSTAKHITLPILVMQGEEDPIFELSATKSFVSLAGSAEKELVCFHCMPHTLLWDPETPDVVRKIALWLTQTSEHGTVARRGTELDETIAARTPEQRRETPGICVYKHDPVLRFLARRRRRFTSVKVFLVYFVILVLGKAVLSGIAGNFTFVGWAQTFVQDLQRFPPFSMLLHFFRKAVELRGSNVPVIPYSRDYVDMGIMTLMAGHMVLVRNQWHTISITLTKLYRAHVLNPLTFSRERYEATCRKFNALFNHPAWSALSLIAALGIVVVVYYSMWTHGIYSGLNSSRAPEWEETAFRNWWSHPVQHPALFAYNALSAVFVCYYMVRHQVVGICSLLLCRSVLATRHGGRESVLVLRPEHPDGLGGVRLLRTIMIRVYESVMIMALCVVLLYFYLPRGTVAPLIPFYLIFFLLSPLYVLVPLSYVRRRIRQSKTRQVAVLRHELQEIVRTRGDAERLLVVQDQIKRLVRIPNLLFSPRRLFSSSVSYAIPVLLFIDWMVRQ